MISIKIAIVAANRTAIAGFNKSFKNYEITDISSKLIDETLKKINLDKNLIDSIIFGSVLQAKRGQNIARQILLKSNIPESSTAYTVNMVCGSGMKAVSLAALEIMTNQADIVIAGGCENMSNANFMLEDGLYDNIINCHMGMTAENIALKYGFTREQLDDFAYNSQMKAKKAIENLRFSDEIIEVFGLKVDEHPRLNLERAKLDTLKPAFKEDGIVTAANSSGINDGAAILVLMTEKKAKELNLEILAYIEAFSDCGLDPKYMGLGPVYAIEKLCKKNDINLNDIEIFELNEAFAAQSLAVISKLNISKEKVNVNGGAIALGHPIGASGARILVTLIHEMKKSNLKKGIASLCIGGGQGIAMYITRK